MNYKKWKNKRNNRKEGRKRKPTFIRLRQQIQTELPKVVDRADRSPIRRYSLLDTCAPSCTQHLASEMPLTQRFAEAQVGSSGSLTATNSCHSTQLCCSWRSSSAHTHQHKSGKGRPAIFDDVSDVVLLPLYKRYSFGVLR